MTKTRPIPGGKGTKAQSLGSEHVNFKLAMLTNSLFDFVSSQPFFVVALTNLKINGHLVGMPFKKHYVRENNNASILCVCLC